MYERILEAIQQAREQGVEPTKIYIPINKFECIDRDIGLQVEIRYDMPKDMDFVIM